VTLQPYIITFQTNVLYPAMKSIAFISFLFFTTTVFPQGLSATQHYSLGLALAKMSEPADWFNAIKEFEQVLRMEPENTDALRQMVLLNVRLKDTVTAAHINLMAIRLGSKAARVYGIDVLHQSLRFADTAQVILPRTKLLFEQMRSKPVRTISELATAISSTSQEMRERLQLFLLWSHENMHADSLRFREGGAPLDIPTAFSKRIGLCEEFSGLTEVFCRLIGTRAVTIYGYTRYPGYRANESLQQFNHAWTMIRIDTGWYLADLLWSICELRESKSGDLQFHQRLQTDYFLALPETFIPEHIPGDPAFQFTDRPRSIHAFTSVVAGVNDKDPRLAKIDYRDSIQILLRLPPEKYRLRFAERAYTFNPANPNDLAVELFNYGVEVYNRSPASRRLLIDAKKCFAQAQILAGVSKVAEIKSLGDACKIALEKIEKRLTTVK
jgi:hypothetical protein